MFLILFKKVHLTFVENSKNIIKIKKKYIIMIKPGLSQTFKYHRYQDHHFFTIFIMYNGTTYIKYKYNLLLL